MANFFALNRQALREFEENLSTRIPGAVSTVLVRMLLMANHNPGRYRGIALERGDVVIGRTTLSALTGLKEKTIRNALSVLIGNGSVTKRASERANEGANGVCVFSIAVYDQFDSMINKGASERANEGASKGPARGQQGATLKEVKEVKERSE